MHFCGVFAFMCGALAFAHPSISIITTPASCTLPPPRLQAWEGTAYAYGRQSLREMGCPVEGLRFDRSLVIRGLIMDTGGLWLHAAHALRAVMASSWTQACWVGWVSVGQGKGDGLRTGSCGWLPTAA